MKRGIFSFCVLAFIAFSIGCGGGGGGGSPAISNLTGGNTDQTDTLDQLSKSVTGISYVRVSSLPGDLMSIGIITSILAKNAPNPTSLRAAVKSSSGTRFLRGSLSVTREDDNTYVINSTNYKNETDYDSTDGIGFQTVRIRYFSGNGTPQTSPDNNTRKVQMQFAGETDYGLVKYTNSTGIYELSLTNNTANWLDTNTYKLSTSEQSGFYALKRTFVYKRTGSLTINSNSGQLLGGTISDSLIDGDKTYTATHVVQGGNCTSTFSADGHQEIETNQTALLADKNLTFSWNASQSVYGNSGYLTLAFSGTGLTYLKSQNDRLNELFPPFPINGSYADSVYARVFQYACSQDQNVKNLYEIILSSYKANNINNLVQYAIDLVTIGIAYQKDSTVFFEEEYVALPSVGLYFGQGDCEDKSILLGSLLYQMQADVVLVILSGEGDSEGHACLGLAMPAEYEATMPVGSLYWSYNGKKYFYLETTDSFPLGQTNPTVQGMKLAAIIPPISTMPTVSASIKEILKSLR